MWLAIWGGILIVMLLLELYTLRSERKGDTFSEQWWKMVKFTRFTRVVGTPLFCWLTYHFFLEPATLALIEWWDDWLIIVVGIFAGWMRNEAKSDIET